MAEYTGVSEHCQECGACVTNSDASCQSSAGATNNAVVDTIVAEVLRSLGKEVPAPSTNMGGTPRIPLGVSNHHIHIREDTFAQLFGAGTAFEKYRDLYQPGEFASKHTCIVVGPKMRPIAGVRILGPFRKYNQVELSLTDAITLGIKPPVRDSGQLDDASPITIIGPKGSVSLEKGAIIAGRHVHMTTADARAFGVSSGDFIRVRIPGVKGTIFENVLVRTNDAWKLQLHLDTDDANAANVRCEVQAEFAGKM